MKGRSLTNLAASVHDRLLNKSKESGRPFNELLQLFAIERFLFRLSRSSHVGSFVLKGALMLRAWESPQARPTKDIDMLGRTANSIENLVAMARDCIAVEVPDDGIRFDNDSVRGERITLDAKYHGVRIHIEGKLGSARLFLQVDFGFGDVIVPGPIEIEYPELLDFGKPRLLGYTPESAIAEKFEAMVDRELANSRMKDFYDIWMLSQRVRFDGGILSRAIRETFNRRGTPLPTEPPLALTSDFSQDAVKLTQWKAFLRKGKLEVNEKTFSEIIDVQRGFLMPAAIAAARNETFEMIWPPQGDWDKRESEA
ncbi:MAG: nucleotidyl transferase AbiEii/AbiGii toxin family protein [Acidobacteriota bacterium]